MSDFTGVGELVNRKNAEIERLEADNERLRADNDRLLLKANSLHDDLHEAEAELSQARALLRHVDETCACARVDIDRIHAFLDKAGERQ